MNGSAVGMLFCMNRTYESQNGHETDEVEDVSDQTVGKDWTAKIISDIESAIGTRPGGDRRPDVGSRDSP